MNAGANIERVVEGRTNTRVAAVAILFGLTLSLLALGHYIVIPDSTGFYDPVHGLLMAALVSALVMVVVGVPGRESRRMLALLLGALGVGLLLLTLSDVSFRFIAESDEGEFSMTLIAMLAAAAILWATAAIRLAPASTGAGATPQYPGLKDFAVRVLWSTQARRAIVISLGGFYAVALVVVLISGDSGLEVYASDSGLAVSLLIVGIATLLGSRASSPTLKTALFIVAGLFGVGVLLSTGIGFLLIVFALHASVAIAGLAASAAAAEAQTPAAKTTYSLLALVAGVAWVVLALYGLFIFALLASGYE